jgi:TPR repeat protein
MTSARRALGLVLLLAGAALPRAGVAVAQDAAKAPASPAQAAAPAAEAAVPPPAGGTDLAYGAYQRGLYLTAKNLAEPLANLGDPAAQTLLGEIYSRGLGVRRDEKTAARWYEAAAKAGSAEGQFRFALLLLDGKSVPQDLAKAQDLMKAAADAGIPLAQYNYGQMLIQASPTSGFVAARPYFEKAAQGGVADAQYAMSQIYAYGRGIAAPDLVTARRWLVAAAVNGQDTAQIELGIWLINGKGGPGDPAEGARWLRRAAAGGNPIAMNRVAHLYKDGIGVAADQAEAAKWSVLAKRANNTDAALDAFFRGLDEAMQRNALDAANRFRAS